MIESSSISSLKKDTIPNTDAQKNKVYSMDSGFLKLIKKAKRKIIFSEDIESDYFKLARAIFENEGFFNFKMYKTTSETTSSIQSYSKVLKFSNYHYNTFDIEVILHELAHAICYFRGGYHYKDAHGELFVFFLIELIYKYFDIEKNELYKVADVNKVKYFFENLIDYTEINENEFLSYLENNKQLNNNYSNCNLLSSKDHSFISYVGYLLTDNTFTSVSKNDNKFYLFKRKMFGFEHDLYVNQFSNLSINKLINIQIFSPIIQCNERGRISKSGSYYTFVDINYKRTINNDFQHNLFISKHAATKARKEAMKKYKSSGFVVITKKNYNQFYNYSSFFREEVLKKANKKTYD